MATPLVARMSYESLRRQLLRSRNDASDRGERKSILALMKQFGREKAMIRKAGGPGHLSKIARRHFCDK